MEALPLLVKLVTIAYLAYNSDLVYEVTSVVYRRLMKVCTVYVEWSVCSIFEYTNVKHSWVEPLLGGGEQ